MAFDPVIIGFGFGIGILVGLTGVGGGSLMTPLLILVLGVKPNLAIGTDLAYGALTKSVGAFRHLRMGNVDLRLSWWLGLGSVPGSLLGVSLLGWLHLVGPANLDSILLRLLACTLILVSLTLVFGKSQPLQERLPLNRRGKFWAIVIGLVVGTVLAITSVGSGALIGLALVAVFRLSPHRVVGTDVFHAAVLLWAAGLAHWQLGNVDLSLMLNMLIGSLPGVWLGSGATQKVNGPSLRLLIALALMASGLALFQKSGLPVPPALILGLPLGLGALLRKQAPQ